MSNSLLGILLRSGWYCKCKTFGSRFRSRKVGQDRRSDTEFKINRPFTGVPRFLYRIKRLPWKGGLYPGPSTAPRRIYHGSVPFATSSQIGIPPVFASVLFMCNLLVFVGSPDGTAKRSLLTNGQLRSVFVDRTE